MIIGRGDIASVLTDRDDRIYFASGVSNSKETKQLEFDREKMLLKDQWKKFVNPEGKVRDDLRLVYFSSLAIFYLNTPYTEHKLQVENFIRLNFPSWAIIRLGNITWGSNPNTLINAMKTKVANGEPLQIQDTTRYIIDKPEFLHWVGLIPNFNVEMNITGQPMKVSKIVKKYVL